MRKRTTMFYLLSTVIFFFLINPVFIQAMGSAPEITTTATSLDCGGDTWVSNESNTPTIWSNEQFSVAVQTDVVYGKALTHPDWYAENGTEMNLLLDIYRPVNAPGNRPAIVLIHGGSFTKNDKQHPQIVKFAQYFAKRGFVAISIDYRLDGHRGTTPLQWDITGELLFLLPSVSDQMRAMYPAARDSKAAVRWLHAHADELDVNTDFITALGDSAGAQLSVMIGVTNEGDFQDEILPYNDWTLNTTHLGYSSKVDTVVELWGSGLIVEILDVLFLSNRWDNSDAPMLMVHGTLDTTVPYEEAMRLSSLYCSSGAPFKFHTLHGLPHGAWDATVYGTPLTDESFNFIKTAQHLYVDPVH